MKKNIKFVKSFVKKLGAPVILIAGLILGFVVDRVTNLLPFPHRWSSQRAEKPFVAMAVCPPMPEHHAAARPVKKAAKVAMHKHARKHVVAAAKKHKKKIQHVASSK